VRPAVYLCCSAFVLAACTRDGPPAFEVRRLADQMVAAMGRSAPMETVGGVMRVTLPGIHVEELQSAPALNRVADSLEVSLACPPSLAGRPAAVLLIGSTTPITQRVRCPPSAESRVEIRLPREATDKGLWLLEGLEFDRVESSMLTLARRTRLHLTFGLAPIVDGSPTPGRFRIVARNPQGRTVSVLKRRLDPTTHAGDGGWVGADIDLDPVRRAIGPDVRLVFEVREDGEASVPTFPVWGDPTLVWPRAGEHQPPRRNVVLISLDTLRADRLGTYGALQPTSPTLDVLARESTLFETVIAPAPWTLPSHASMMTGLYPCVHGATGVAGNPLPAAVVPLAQRLREAGYSTAAFTEDANVAAGTFARGFGYFWENREGDDRVRGTVAQAMRWLRDEAAEPFFLFFHTYQSHAPYYAPPEYRQMFQSIDGLGVRVPPAMVSRSDEALAKYDAAIRYTDASIAALLDMLRQTPRGERTLIVVTSDHGEAFMEHGYMEHGRTLHEEVLRVPLLFWGPGLVAAGRRVPGPVGVIDVSPTILDLLGQAVPPGIGGVSLAPQVLPGEPPPLGERVLFSENTRYNTYRLAARARRFKAMWTGPGLQIFDLDRDPTERQPITSPALATHATFLRLQFEEQCRKQRALIDAAAPALPAPATLPDPDLERRLRAMGYVE
jgi:arylsulfatase A-like enzyme